MASQYLARLGIVLGIDSGELVTGIEAAKKQFKQFTTQVEKDTKAAMREAAALKDATEDYGKTLTKVEQIEREISRGRFQFAAQNVKDVLLAEAKAYDAKAASMKKMNGALTDQQKLQVSYQLTDFFTQIASGQNAMIAFIQQGGQLKDSMGGVGNAISAITSLLTPARLAFGAIAGTLGAVGLAFYQGSEESKKFNQAMALTNQFAGIGIDRFTDLGKSISTNFGIAVGESRLMMQQLVASGQFTYRSLDSVAGVIARISHLSGQSADEVASKLIPSFDGSASSAKKLNDTYHFLTLAQYQQIEALSKQGKAQEATKLTADLLNNSLQNQEIRLGYIEQLWKNAKEAASDFWDWAKSVGREKDPLREQLDDQIKLMESYVRMGGEGAIKGVRYQAALNEYKRIAAEIDAKESEKAKIADAKAKDALNIGDYEATGGSDRSAQMAAQRRKTRYETAIEQLKVFAGEEERIRLDAQKSIADKVFEIEGKTAQERRARGAELEEQLSLDIIKINAERDRKIADLHYKQYIKELETDIAAMRHAEEFQKQESQRREAAFQSAGKAAMAAEAENQFQRENLQLQMEMIGATEKQRKIAEEKLRIEKEIADWKRTQEYHDLTVDNQKYYEDQKRLASQAKINNMELADSLKKTQEVSNSVWQNMSQAIDQFVETGKLSFKSLAGSIIKDILKIQLKMSSVSFLNMAFESMGFGFRLPGRATGGSVDSGSPYMVGEKGPELFIPQSAGTIVPNNRLSDSVGANTTVNNYNINAIDVKSFEQRLLESSNTIWAGYQYANKSLASNGRRA